MRLLREVVLCLLLQLPISMLCTAEAPILFEMRPRVGFSDCCLDVYATLSESCILEGLAVPRSLRCLRRCAQLAQSLGHGTTLEMAANENRSRSHESHLNGAYAWSFHQSSWDQRGSTLSLTLGSFHGMALTPPMHEYFCGFFLIAPVSLIFSS